MGKRGIIMPNSVGVIDADYRGEVGVLLMNTHDEATLIQRGERIAQFMVEKVLDAKFVQVTEEELTQTERGEGGFGSTGR
jgi:dUTP pyrophosphatase